MSKLICRAVRGVIVTKTGKADIQAEYFNLRQPPLKEYKKIVSKKNRYHAYVRWAMSTNGGDLHASELQDWVARKVAQGYDIQFED